MPNVHLSELAKLRRERSALRGKLSRRYERLLSIRSEIAGYENELSVVERQIRQLGGK